MRVNQGRSGGQSPRPMGRLCHAMPCHALASGQRTADSGLGPCLVRASGCVEGRCWLGGPVMLAPKPSKVQYIVLCGVQCVLTPSIDEPGRVLCAAVVVFAGSSVETGWLDSHFCPSMDRSFFFFPSTGFTPGKLTSSTAGSRERCALGWAVSNARAELSRQVPPPFP